jgi:acetyl esterase/lipase
VPHWVKCDRFEIPQVKISEAAELLQKNLGPYGIEQVGGKEWWQWRRDKSPLEAEWIEMRSDYHERKANDDKGRRVLLYIHGGAYYFGSTDEHRYQIQRHARKLKARCLAPRYRLAPQFPFPCGLHDCLSAYLYLLTEYDASSIVVAGDSAGGGMVLAMLVVLRDQGIPLPAGGMLLSPWVDLMHSFPSIGGDGAQDYIPATGFIHKPSMSWPPPTLEEVAVDDGIMPSGVAAARSTESSEPQENGGTTDKSLVADASTSQEMTQGVSIETNKPESEPDKLYKSNMTGRVEPPQHLPWVVVDGKHVQIRDQIQLYAPNHLLNHPLVSPVLQPSLGGLCPLLIQAGGGEMLRDEQVYLGHKAAHPEKYLPSEELLNIHDPERSKIYQYPPTDVQLQVWDDLCHVPHTLAWTRPAKYMYRSVAQFGAWALAHAQHRAIDIPEDDTSDSDSDDSPDDEFSRDDIEKKRVTRRSEIVSDMHTTAHIQSREAVGRAGDPLPPFKNHMIRQRVDRHGNIYAMAPVSELPELHMHRDEIGTLKAAPVRKWLGRQAIWNKKFAHTKVGMQKKRAKQLDKGYVGIPEGERPPPTALAGRRPADMPKLAKVKKSWGMSMWSGWGSKHDEVRVR